MFDPTAQTIKVLVLDKPQLAEPLLRSTLVPLGCLIIPSSSAALAVFLARKNYPSLVVCGVEAAGEEFELAREIKSDPELAHIPVVVIAKQQDQQLADSAFEHGADKFLALPLAPEHLVWELRKYLVPAQDDRPEETSE